MKKLKRYFGDLVYSIMGVCAMNGVVQLIVYPYLTSQMGAERFGSALSMISLVSIIGSTFGVAANYSRVVTKERTGEANGDYNIFLLWIALASVAISILGIVWLDSFTVLKFISFYLLMVFTLLRYYSDVEFRLNVNYKGFFNFYLLISLGYLLGILLYSATKLWMITMLFGEVLAVGYVIYKGSIFKRPLFKKTEYFRNNIRSMILMSVTELILALILNADRLILQSVVGGTSVTVFYTATLIGKMVSLFTSPLNGVLIGYLAKSKKIMSAKIYGMICFLGLLLGCLLSAICVVVSNIFVSIMYRDVYELAMPYFWMGNASQVFYFVSNTLTVILLRYSDEKYQLYINIVYLIFFMLITIPLVMLYGLWGMAVGLLVVNLLKILVVMIWGMRILQKNNN